MRPRVVIIGHGSTSRLGIVRSVAAYGCDITLVVVAWKRRMRRRPHLSRIYDCYSRYVDRVHYLWGNDADGLVRLLLDKCTDPHQKVILLPDSDFSAATVDTYYQQLDPYFVFPHIKHQPGMLTHWMDKSVQKAVAREVGLHVAESVTIDITNGHYRLPDAIPYPVFTKAQVTLNGGKQCFSRCDDEAALRSFLDKLVQRYQTQVLAEEYLDIEKEYAVVGFSDGEQVAIPAVIEFLRYSKSHFGIAMLGKVMPVTGFEPLLEQFKELMRRIGFVGVFDIDFFYARGRYYFGEVNLRFGGSGYAVTKQKTASNLPLMLVRYFQGDPVDIAGSEIDRTQVFVNERVCFDDWYWGLITTSDYRRCIAAADFGFIDDPVDRRPKRLYNLVFAEMYVRRIFKRLMGRK